jgi:transposase
MARKNCTDEFRRRAVDLNESTPGATLLGVAADLGISRGALKDWVHRRGSGVATERDILRQVAKYFAGETNW